MTAKEMKTKTNRFDSDSDSEIITLQNSNKQSNYNNLLEDINVSNGHPRDGGNGNNGSNKRMMTMMMKMTAMVIMTTMMM